MEGIHFGQGNLTGFGPWGGGTRRGGTGKQAGDPWLQDCWTEIQGPLAPGQQGKQIGRTGGQRIGQGKGQVGQSKGLLLAAGCPWQAGAGG